MSPAVALFVLVAALFIAVASAPAVAGEFTEGTAFPPEQSGWHSVTVDLGSSVLVRIYGKILTETTPTDITVTMGETLSFVNAWIGDSKGNPVQADALERYLVIEGTAANLTEANDTAIQALLYTLNGVRYAQFAKTPMRLAAASSSDNDSAGGCEAGFGLASLAFALAIASVGALKRRR